MRSARWLALLSVFLFTRQAQAQQQPPCLSYEPSVVELQGTILREEFPGPPDYENSTDKQNSETYWLLYLPNPVCLDARKDDVDLHPAQKDVLKIQLVFSNPEAYKTYANLVGKTVLAKGTLFASHTGHHHTPVLLTVSTLQPIKPAKDKTQHLDPASIPGCYELTPSPWRREPVPTPNDEAPWPIPNRLQLLLERSTNPVAEDAGGYAVKPALEHGWSYWRPKGPHTIEVLWSTGFGGMVMGLQVEGSDLRGQAVTFLDYGGQTYRADITAKRIDCSSP